MDYGDLDDYAVYRALTGGDRQAMHEMLRRYGAALRELVVSAGLRSGVESDELMLHAVMRMMASSPEVGGWSLWRALEMAVEEVASAGGVEVRS
jgi:hypothetical protein